MSAGDVTARSVLELRESMIETTMDDRWCARSVCEDAIEALEASRAEVASLRRQLEEQRVVVPVPTQDEHDAIYPAPDLAENEMAYRAFWNAFEKGATWVASRIRPLSPGEVVVGREEWEILRDGFGLLRTAWNISGFNERLSAQADALIERLDALRSGEAPAQRGEGANHV